MDKDPDLRSDHYKTEVRTIGLNQESFFSEVAQQEESLMNISNVSKDQVIKDLLGEPNPNPEVKSVLGERDDLGDSLRESFLKGESGKGRKTEGGKDF